MNYIKTEKNGQIFHSAKITGAKDPALRDQFVAIDGPNLKSFSHNPGLRALVLTSVFRGVGSFQADKYAVFIPLEGKMQEFPINYASRAIAETAASALAVIYGEAHVAVLDYKKPREFITQEDDPEAWDSFYEHEGIIRNHNDEENGY